VSWKAEELSGIVKEGKENTSWERFLEEKSATEKGKIGKRPNEIPGKL